MAAVQVGRPREDIVCLPSSTYPLWLPPKDRRELSSNSFRSRCALRCSSVGASVGLGMPAWPPCLPPWSWAPSRSFSRGMALFILLLVDQLLLAVPLTSLQMLFSFRSSLRSSARISASPKRIACPISCWSANVTSGPFVPGGAINRGTDPKGRECRTG